MDISGSITNIAFAKCDCCGLTEECTDEYIKRVRDRYSGRWICGLCSEAVKDELIRSEERIGNEEALNKHMNFYKKFKSLSPPKNPTEDLISAVKQLMFKSLDSPRSSPVKKPVFVRPEGCLPAVDSPRSSPVKKLVFTRHEGCLPAVNSPLSSPVKKPVFARPEGCLSALDV